MSYMDQILQAYMGQSPIQQSAMSQVGMQQPMLGNNAMQAFQASMASGQRPRRGGYGVNLANAMGGAPNAAQLPTGEMLDAQMQYDNTQSRRMGGGIAGGLEGIWDAFREKGARENLVQATENFAGQKDDIAQVAEMEERGIAMRVIAQYNPKMTEEQIMPLAKAVVSGQADLTDFIPTAQDPGQLRQEYETLVGIYGEDGAKQMLSTKYQEKGGGAVDETKPFNAMPGETKVKLGLISSASNLLEKAVPVMFEEDGNWRSMEAVLPKSDVGIARDDLRESLIQTLRATSGAAIPETEIEREVDSMMPSLTDSDKQARAKIERIRSKLNRLHTAMVSGYRDVPNPLQIVEPGSMGQSEQAGATGLPPGFVEDQ